MSGLNPDWDHILEVAVIITTPKLEIVAEGPNRIIHVSDTVLEAMDPWNTSHHGDSGLTQASRQSTNTCASVEQEIVSFLAEYCVPKTAPLCGNSVFHDRLFLKRQMPRVVDFLHYRIIDVSSVKQIVRRWYPNDPRAFFQKREAHRALADIKESIGELAQYRTAFFRGDLG